MKRFLKLGMLAILLLGVIIPPLNAQKMDAGTFSGWEYIEALELTAKAIGQRMNVICVKLFFYFFHLSHIIAQQLKLTSNIASFNVPESRAVHQWTIALELPTAGHGVETEDDKT